MPKLPPTVVPQYLLHEGSNQARMYVDEQEIWLGPHGSPASHEKYNRILAEWLENGRQLPHDCGKGHEMTVSELIVEYLAFAKREYSKNGEPTKEFKNLRIPLRVAQKLYGSMPAKDLGPRALKAVRCTLLDQHLVFADKEQPDKGPKALSRGYINDSINRIRRMFRWGVEQQFLPPTVIQALDAVAGLRRGRGGVETGKITVVPEAFVEAVKPFVSRQVWGLIQLQLCTGMRPGEAICLRGRDLNTSGTLWEIAPTDHKTAHFGIDRVIIVGPRGQVVLKPFLKSKLEEYLFSPQDAQRERYAALRTARKTKVPPSQQCRKKATPKREPEQWYSVDSYRRAIHRACDLADEAARKGALQAGKQLAEGDRLVPRWSPNRLRHNFATRMRREYGIETARILLGHTSASTTEIYAEADRMKAVKVMEEVG